MENASRKLKQALLLKNSISKEAAKMAAQSAGASRVTYFYSIPQQNAVPAPQTPISEPVPDELNAAGDDGVRHTGPLEERYKTPLSTVVDIPPAPVHRPAPLIEVDFDLESNSFVSEDIRMYNRSTTMMPNDQQALYYAEQQAQYVAEQDYYAGQFDPNQVYYPVEQLSQFYGLEDLTVDGTNDDEYDSLARDQSYWQVEGMDAPGIVRRMMPVVISEDGQFDSVDYNGYDNGFTMQPPPHSNSIISTWNS
jgi:hypothetical protein